MFAKFVAFDLETTGLSPAKDEIIEIGAVKFTVVEEAGKIKPKLQKTFQTLVKPNMLIPAEVTAINNITNKMVEDAPGIAESLKKFTAFCGLDTILVAHNADFDASFLRAAYEKNPQFVPKNPIIDSLKIARSIFPELPNHKLGDMAQTFKRRGLISMEITPGEMHRAVYDCEMLMEVLVAILSRRMVPAEWDMSKILQTVANFKGTPQYLSKNR